MKQILRQTFELFRRNPILWLPYILAQLLAGFAWRMRTSVAQHLIQAAQHFFDRIFGQRSAFGFLIEAPSSDIENLRRFLIAYVPLGVISQLLYVCLFVIALAVTATMVESILSGREPELMPSVNLVLRRWRQTLRFTLKSYLFCFASMVLVLLAVTLAPDFFMDRTFTDAMILTSAAQLTFVAIAAWLWMPGALRFLQPSAPRPIHSDARRLGFIFTVLAIASTVAVGIVVIRFLQQTEFDTQRELAVVVAASDVLINSAIAPLFIALSLLALKTPEDPQIEDELPL